MSAQDVIVQDYWLGGDGLEAYYIEDPRPAMAIDPDVDPEERRCWELVAHGLYRADYPAELRRWGFHTSRIPGGLPFHGSDFAREVSPLVVEAIKRVVREMEPDWVAAVWHVMHLADDERVLASWTGVPLEAVCAICDLLDAEGLERWCGFFGSGE